MNHCPVCNNEIPPRTHGGGSPKLFCSEKCRKKQESARRYRNNKDRVREIQRAWNERNKKKIKAASKAWQQKNKQVCAATARRYRENNPGAAYKAQLKYKRKHPDRVAALEIRRRRDCIPPWLSDEQIQQIKDIYLLRDKLNEETGIRHEVDHIEPVNGDDRCGLHVPWNLRVVTEQDNRSKGSKIEELIG